MVKESVEWQGVVRGEERGEMRGEMRGVRRGRRGKKAREMRGVDEKLSRKWWS